MNGYKVEDGRLAAFFGELWEHELRIKGSAEIKACKVTRMIQVRIVIGNGENHFIGITLDLTLGSVKEIFIKA